MILKKIEDTELAGHIEALPADRREVFLLADGTLRLSGVSATSMVNHMRANHGTGIMETYVLGQGYIAGALLQSTVKGNDRIRLDIECGGPSRACQSNPGRQGPSEAIFSRIRSRFRSRSTHSTHRCSMARDSSR